MNQQWCAAEKVNIDTSRPSASSHGVTFCLIQLPVLEQSQTGWKEWICQWSKAYPSAIKVYIPIMMSKRKSIPHFLSSTYFAIYRTKACVRLKSRMLLTYLFLFKQLLGIWLLTEPFFVHFRVSTVLDNFLDRWI